MKLLNTLYKFRALSASEKKLLIAGIFLSAIISFAVRLIPLRWYYRLLSLNPRQEVHENLKKDRIVTLIKAVKRVKKIAPWNCNCLNQVITLKLLSLNMGIPGTVKFTLTDLPRGKGKAHATLIMDNRYEYLALANSKNQYIDLCLN
jgi:hypothetical protein